MTLEDWAVYAQGVPVAILVTLKFTVAAFVGSIALGAIIAIMRTSKTFAARGPALVYTEIFKNLPLITAIYLIYFGLPSLGIRFDVFTAGTLALVLFYGAYMSEVFRGGLQAVPEGQREAASALGMRARSVTLTIVLPQAVRHALPGAGTMLVDLLKGTSLLVTIGGGELMTEGTIMTALTFRPLEVYTLIGAIYFALCFPLSRAVGRLERRLASGVPISPARRSFLRDVDRQLGDRVDALSPRGAS